MHIRVILISSFNLVHLNSNMNLYIRIKHFEKFKFKISMHIRVILISSIELVRFDNYQLNLVSLLFFLLLNC